MCYNRGGDGIVSLGLGPSKPSNTRGQYPASPLMATKQVVFMADRYQRELRESGSSSVELKEGNRSIIFKIAQGMIE